MSLKNLFLHIFLFFVNFLPSLINVRSHKTLLVIEEGAIEHVLRGKIWFYRFDGVFTQVSIDFLFVVSICCSLRTRKRK